MKFENATGKEALRKLGWNNSNHSSNSNDLL
jgi:hypothetical protein